MIFTGRKEPVNKLERKNGRWYENGKPLRKKDYIFHASAHERAYVLTDNGKYRV